jgi:hypothetical protein
LTEGLPKRGNANEVFHPEYFKTQNDLTAVEARELMQLMSDKAFQATENGLCLGE